MSFRKMKEYEVELLLGYDLAISASGDNPIIDATDLADTTPFVGAGNVLNDVSAPIETVIYAHSVIHGRDLLKAVGA